MLSLYITFADLLEMEFDSLEDYAPLHLNDIKTHATCRLVSFLGLLYSSWKEQDSDLHFLEAVAEQKSLKAFA